MGTISFSNSVMKSHNAYLYGPVNHGLDKYMNILVSVVKNQSRSQLLFRWGILGTLELLLTNQLCIFLLHSWQDLAPSNMADKFWTTHRHFHKANICRLPCDTRMDSLMQNIITRLSALVLHLAWEECLRGHVILVEK